MDSIALIGLLGLAFLLMVALYWMALERIGNLCAGSAYDAETIRDLKQQLAEALQDDKAMRLLKADNIRYEREALQAALREAGECRKRLNMEYGAQEKLRAEILALTSLSFRRVG